MAQPSAPLATLTPDKRAAVELVLRRGLSYGELASLLSLPEETVRERARAGLEALAPDLPPPARAGEIADWLLGQQAPPHAARTRTLVAGDAGNRRWAETVAAPLRELSDDVPSLDEDLPAPRAGAGTRPRPLRDATPAPAPAATAEPAPPAASPGRSSRLGGAILVGAALVIVAAVIFFVLIRGGNDDADSPPDTTAATATATATATVGPGELVLRGPAGSQSLGVLQLFKAEDNTLRFLLVGQGIAPNKPGQRYSLWLRKDNGQARLLGDVKDAVKKDGKLTAAGPGTRDVKSFPTWYTTYDNLVVTLDPKGAKTPGRVILSGDLPKSTG
jgi:Sigma-70, region 4